MRRSVSTTRRESSLTSKRHVDSNHPRQCGGRKQICTAILRSTFLYFFRIVFCSARVIASSSRSILCSCNNSECSRRAWSIAPRCIADSPYIAVKHPTEPGLGVITPGIPSAPKPSRARLNLAVPLIWTRDGLPRVHSSISCPSAITEPRGLPDGRRTGNP